jgi:hypothetical protein
VSHIGSFQNGFPPLYDDWMPGWKEYFPTAIMLPNFQDSCLARLQICLLLRPMLIMFSESLILFLSLVSAPAFCWFPVPNLSAYILFSKLSVLFICKFVHNSNYSVCFLKFFFLLSHSALCQYILYVLKCFFPSFV